MEILWGFAPASAALRHQMSSSTQMSSPAKFHQTPFWSARDCWPIQSSAGADFYYTKWAELVVMNPIFTWEEEAITQTLGLFYGLEVCVGAGFSILLYGLPQYYLYFIISIGYCYEFSSFCNAFLCLFMNNEIGHRTDSILHLNHGRTVWCLFFSSHAT